MVPLARFPGCFDAVNLGSDGHFAGDTLEVLDGAAEVDTSHGLHQDFQFISCLDRWQGDALFVFHPINLTDVFSIDEHLREVMEISGQQTWFTDGWQGGRVVHSSPTQVHFLESFEFTMIISLLLIINTIENGRKLLQLELWHRDDAHWSLWHSRHLLTVVVLRHHLAKLIELRSGKTIFVDRSIVVVAGNVWSKARAVRTCPVSETRSSVRHVEREANALRKHFVHAIDHVFRIACFMACAPFVEPSRPEFRTHLRSIGTQLTKTTELIVDVSTCAEVHCPHQIVQSVLLEVRTPVALEESQLLAIDATQTIPDSTHVRLVLAIATIFVLHLHHDDRSTLLNGKPCKLLAHLLLEDFHAFHEVRVLLTQADVLLLQEPPRQTAHFPFRTNVWTRAHNHVHAILLSQFAECSHVVVVREVEHAFLLLVDIPENVDANGIHTQCLRHLDAVVPIGTRNARVVHFGSLHDEWFSIQHERAFARLESTLLLRHHWQTRKGTE